MTIFTTPFSASLPAADERQSWLRQLFVDPSARQSGIGTALLDVAKRAMPGGFRLRTPADNVVARTFYERRGLRADGIAAHERWGVALALYRWP